MQALSTANSLACQPLLELWTHAKAIELRVHSLALNVDQSLTALNTAPDIPEADLGG